jgi:hypothetical protein
VLWKAVPIVQRIHFCTGSSFLTGDDVADAVLQYAWALAQYGRHDLVRVPTRREGGSMGTAALLLGPATQISSEEVVTDLDDLADQELVDRLLARAAHLREPMPAAQFEDADWTSSPDGQSPVGF